MRQESATTLEVYAWWTAGCIERENAANATAHAAHARWLQRRRDRMTLRRVYAFDVTSVLRIRLPSPIPFGLRLGLPFCVPC